MWLVIKVIGAFEHDAKLYGNMDMENLLKRIESERGSEHLNLIW